jgi:Endonuclease/Exonuclease/phosphatase family
MGQGGADRRSLNCHVAARVVCTWSRRRWFSLRFLSIRNRCCSLLAVFSAAFPSALRAAPPAEGAEEIVVASYNVENYLGEESEEDLSRRRAKPKSEKAVAAVIRIVKDIHPDILGVCEMGSPEEFAAFKARLEAEGLGYTDSEYVNGPDPDRHLALVSRFPIVARQSTAEVPYELDGAPEKVRRGFLDVTIRVNPQFDLRLVGVHLKSKLAIEQGEALVRRHEAQLLREHLEAIMTSDPRVNLLVYGDFNDNRNEPAMQAVAGVRGSPGYLTDLQAKDSLGDRWTQYWKLEDLYSRIDYFFANSALLHEVVPSKTLVYRSEYWNEASDHRAIYTSIVPAKRK